MWRAVAIAVALGAIVGGRYRAALDRPLLEAGLVELGRRNALMGHLFDQQRAAYTDPSPYVAVWKTRRAGATYGVLTKFLDKARKKPGGKAAYIAKTHPSAEDIAWPILHRLDRRFGLGCKFQEAKLRCILPGGGSIKLYGADRPGWMDRLYGQEFDIGVAIDEAAFYSIDLRALIQDILETAVILHGGQIYLLSIPGHLPTGLFDDIIRQFQIADAVPLPRATMSSVKAYIAGTRLGGVRPQPTKDCPDIGSWSVHRWTTADNPVMRDRYVAEMLAKIKAQPDIIADAHFLRNYLGLRVAELGDRVYRWDPDRNTWRGAAWQKTEGDRFVLGIDFGWDDYQAFSLNVWREDSPFFLELESHRKKHMLLDEAHSYVRMFMDWCRPHDLMIVADPAHKQLFEEFRRRFDVPVIPAEKANKFDWISVYNTDLASGHVQIVDPASSPHVEEMQGLTWKVRPDGSRLETPGQKNDCCDAHLIAYRHSYHYRHEEPLPEQTADQRADADLLAELAAEDEKQEAWNDI